MTSSPTAASSAIDNNSGMVLTPNTVINASTTTNHPQSRQSRLNCLSSAKLFNSN
jgi:hypothetical protein